MKGLKAYLDKAERIISSLLTNGYKIIAEGKDLVAFRLYPDPSPIFPKLSGFLVKYGDSFHRADSNDMGTWHWSKDARANLLLQHVTYPKNYPESLAHKSKTFNFSVSGLDRCNIWMSEDLGVERKILSKNQISALVSIKLERRVYRVS